MFQNVLFEMLLYLFFLFFIIRAIFFSVEIRPNLEMRLRNFVLANELHFKIYIYLYFLPRQLNYSWDRYCQSRRLYSWGSFVFSDLIDRKFFVRKTSFFKQLFPRKKTVYDFCTQYCILKHNDEFYFVHRTVVNWSLYSLIWRCFFMFFRVFLMPEWRRCLFFFSHHLPDM